MNSLKSDSLGKILVKARKSLNLSKKDISKKLCLKLEIINNIENDILSFCKIPKVFLYGYIYSYARLVNIPRRKILFFLKKNKINSCINSNFINKISYFSLFINFIYLNRLYIVKLLVLTFLSFIYFYEF